MAKKYQLREQEPALLFRICLKQRPDNRDFFRYKTTWAHADDGHQQNMELKIQIKNLPGKSKLGNTPFCLVDDHELVCLGQKNQSLSAAVLWARTQSQ